MRKSIAATIAASALTLAFSMSTPVSAADADPTVHQIYQAAETGHLDQAQQMMDQVLIDHPKSGTAHFVQAELYARQGKISLARSELGVAESLDPGLPHIAPQSVQSLKSQLGLGSRMIGPVGMGSLPAARPFPWGMVLVLAAAIGVLWLLFRRRSTYVQYSGAPAIGGAGASGGPGVYGGPAAPGGGVGSGIVGGIASGLAVGAGVVAGEELARHFLDGGRRDTGVLPPAGDAGQSQSNNGDMGGSDFGVNDPGSSWDDGGSGGGGDWS